MIRRSLPLNSWPEADRKAWNAACQPTARLRRGGAAGHLKPVTRDDYALHYGCFLGFLDRCGLLRSDGPAAANVIADKINAYLTDLKSRVGSVRVHGSICTLRRVAQHIAPGRDYRPRVHDPKDIAAIRRRKGPPAAILQWPSKSVARF